MSVWIQDEADPLALDLWLRASNGAEMFICWGKEKEEAGELGSFCLLLH